jgi:hypothetical protein
MGRRPAARARVGEASGEHDAGRAAARAFLDWHASRIVAGGLAFALFDMTPAARLQAIDIAAERATLDEPVGFEMRDAGMSGGAYAFDVTYVGDDEQRLTIRECVAETQGGWRIVSVG